MLPYIAYMDPMGFDQVSSGEPLQRLRLKKPAIGCACISVYDRR